MRFARIFPYLIIIAALAAGCSYQEPEPDMSEGFAEDDDTYQFTITVQDHNGSPTAPAGLYIYEPEKGRERAPIATFSDDGNGLITAHIEKGTPAVARVHAAYHRPLYLFLPSFSGDRLSATVQPVPFTIMPDVQPRVLGNFNHYDDFSALPLEPMDDGTWHTVIKGNLDSLTYILDGFSEILKIHGTEGELAASSTHTVTEPGIKTVQFNDGSNRFEIVVDPAQFPTQENDPVIRFDEDTPVMISGIAKIYAEMVRMADEIQVLDKRDQTITEGRFDSYLIRLQQIPETNDHPKVEQASRLAKANFSDFLHPDDEWVDRLMSDIEPNSELWLMHYPVISELFTHSSRMEEVSRNLWDIYRQHGFENIQGEALYNLLKFHYERGEDEEWYQAHFDLVREYPDHRRINYSYNRGYTPEAVVFVDRYFPELTFRSADRTTEFTPSEIDASLNILFFWKPDDEQSLRQIQRLSRLYDRFKDEGLSVTAVALYTDAERIMRFHDHHNLAWNTAAETLQSAAVQVIGITSVPHTIVLDAANRVLVNNDEFLNDERIEYMVEEYFLNH